jgi:hypothetical protein
LEFNSGDPDLISVPLWKTPLFYAGSTQIALKKGHFHTLFAEGGSKMAQKHVSEQLTPQEPAEFALQS